MINTPVQFGSPIKLGVQVNTIDLGLEDGLLDEVQGTHFLDGGDSYLICGIAELERGRFAVGFTDYLFSRGHRGIFETIRATTSGEMSLVYGGEFFLGDSPLGSMLIEANATSGFIYKDARKYFSNVKNDVGILGEALPYIERYIKTDSSTVLSPYNSNRVHLDEFFNQGGTNIRHNLRTILSSLPDLTKSSEIRNGYIPIYKSVYDEVSIERGDYLENKVDICVYTLRKFLDYAQRSELQGFDVVWWLELLADLNEFKQVLIDSSQRCAMFDGLLDLDDYKISSHVLYRLSLAVKFIEDHTIDKRNHKYDILFFRPN